MATRVEIAKANKSYVNSLANRAAQLSDEIKVLFNNADYRGDGSPEDEAIEEAISSLLYNINTVTTKAATLKMLLKADGAII